MEPTTKAAAPEKIDLTVIINDIWNSLKRRWPLVLLTVIALAFLSRWVASMRYVPRYAASATFVVQSAENGGSDTDSFDRNAASRVAEIFPYIIRSDVLQQIVASDLGTGEMPGEIMVNRIGETSMIRLTVTAEEGELAYNILKAILDHYGEIAKGVLGDTTLTMLEMDGVPHYPQNAGNGRLYARRGALAGLVFWIVIFAILSSVKKTIRNEEELKRTLSAPCLGGIPRVPRRAAKKGKGACLIRSEDAPYAFIEAFRTLRTRVERDHAESRAQVYLVSSALAEEGKSTVAVNLALSLVKKGRRVVIVDMDLRNPSVLKILKGDAKEISYPGVSEVLAGKVEGEEVLIEHNRSGLSILPAGRSVRNVSRALNDGKLADLFSFLRKQADYVIVDTPPSSVVSDAAALVRHMDAGIFVIRQDYAPLKYIREGVGILDDTGLRIAGCVLNQTERGIMDYAYGYGYGYGRYGRYGKEEKKEEAVDA